MSHEISIKEIYDELRSSHPNIEEECIPAFVICAAAKDTILKKVLEENPEFLDSCQTAFESPSAAIGWREVATHVFETFGQANQFVDVFLYSYLCLLDKAVEGAINPLFLEKYFATIIELAPSGTKGDAFKEVSLRPRCLTDSVGMGGIFSTRFWTNMVIDVMRQKTWNVPWIESDSPYLRFAMAQDLAAMNNQMECPAEMFPYKVYWIDANEIFADASSQRSADVVIEDLLNYVRMDSTQFAILCIDNANLFCEAGGGTLFVKTMKAAMKNNVRLILSGAEENPETIDPYVSNLNLHPPDKKGFMAIAMDLANESMEEHLVDYNKWLEYTVDKVIETEGHNVDALVRFMDHTSSSFRNERTLIHKSGISLTDNFADNFISYIDKIQTKPLKMTKKFIDKSFERIYAKKRVEKKSEPMIEVENLDIILKKTIFGQDEAIEKLHNSLVRSKANLRRRKGPLGVFLFLGDSGVGKTYTAEQLHKTVYGEGKAIRLDMSEYADATAINKLFGSAQGYIGYAEGSAIMKEVKARPYSVLLIDEIEKAHPQVHNAFLHIFDEGYARDNRGEIIDFTNTIILMTGNIGSAELGAKKGLKMGFVDHETDEEFNIFKKENAFAEIKRTFRPEFINRIDDVIFYNPLSRDNVKSIIKFELNEIKEGCKNKKCELKYDDEIIEFLATKSVDPLHNGARLVSKVIRDLVETPLSVAFMKSKSIKKAAIKVNNGEISLKVA